MRIVAWACGYSPKAWGGVGPCVPKIDVDRKTQACERAIARARGDVVRGLRGRNRGAGTLGCGLCKRCFRKLSVRAIIPRTCGGGTRVGFSGSLVAAHRTMCIVPAI